MVNMIDRRALLVGGGALLATGLPGFATVRNTIETGAFKVSTFSDGHLNLPERMFAPDVDPALRAQALMAAGQRTDIVASPLNVTLIETAQEKILVDVGAGARFMASAGKLADSLAAGGVDPDSITKIIFTHAHPDHLWGTVNDFDELSFPNAACYISEVEFNFWTASDVLSKLPQERHGFAIGAQRSLEAIKSNLATIKPGREIVSGVHVFGTPGHTPGHISVEVGSGKGSIVILGDALVHPIISFQHPEWRPETDQEQSVAVATRKRLLEKLATDDNRIIGYHLPTSGVGRVERKGSGYLFAALK